MKKILLILIVFVCGSCSFYSFTGASISNNIKTFSVEYFPNKSSLIKAPLSSIFTEKLKENFRRQTSLNQTNKDGDLSFSGEITSYIIKPIAIQANETARQNRLSITIKVIFTNNYEEKLNFNTNFSRYKDFPADQDLSLIEELYMEQICDEIVEDIFNKAVVNW